MKARPCVWLDPIGGILLVRFVLVSLCSLQGLLWIVVLSVELEILFVGLLRHSNNNNNNNVHNTIGMNRDDAALVNIGQEWKVQGLCIELEVRLKTFASSVHVLLVVAFFLRFCQVRCCECTFLALRCDVFWVQWR